MWHMIQIVIFYIIDIVVFIGKGLGAFVCWAGISETLAKIISAYLNVPFKDFYFYKVHNLFRIREVINLTGAIGLLIYTKRWKLLPTITSMITTALLCIGISSSIPYPRTGIQEFGIFLIQIMAVIIVNYTFYYRTSSPKY